MALPSFLCIGATKAGTTWLNAQLECHPEVCMPVVKELHYFSAVNTPGHQDWATRTVTRAFKREFRHARQAKNEGAASPAATAMVRHLRGLLAMPFFSDDWYRACFDRPDKPGGLCGEITPAYAELSDAGIEHVNRLLPGVRIIHLLRHPLDRALSHLRMAAHRREVDASEDALMRLLEGNPQIFSRGEYQTQVPRWRRHVPPERLLLLPFGRVREAPLPLLRDVENFIGATPFDGYPLTEQVNTTRRIDIPPSVIEHLQTRVQPTIDFLSAEFGEDFLRATR